MRLRAILGLFEFIMFFHSIILNRTYHHSCSVYCEVIEKRLVEAKFWIISKLSFHQTFLNNLWLFPQICYSVMRIKITFLTFSVGRFLQIHLVINWMAVGKHARVKSNQIILFLYLYTNYSSNYKYIFLYTG